MIAGQHLLGTDQLTAAQIHGILDVAEGFALRPAHNNEEAAIQPGPTHAPRLGQDVSRAGDTAYQPQKIQADWGFHTRPCCAYAS